MPTECRFLLDHGGPIQSLEYLANVKAFNPGCVRKDNLQSHHEAEPNGVSERQSRCQQAFAMHQECAVPAWADETQRYPAQGLGGDITSGLPLDTTALVASGGTVVAAQGCWGQRLQVGGAPLWRSAIGDNPIPFPSRVAGIHGLIASSKRT